MENLGLEQRKHEGWQKVFSRRYLQMTWYSVNMCDNHSLKKTEALLTNMIANALWKTEHGINRK